MQLDIPAYRLVRDRVERIVIDHVFASGRRRGGDVIDPANRIRRIHLARRNIDRRERREQAVHRSEDHTSELQSLMRTTYAVFCLKNKKQERHSKTYINN